jgi:hypothetical protein
MRPVSSDRDQMYRVDLQLLTDAPGSDSYPIYETTDWDEAQQLANEVRKRLSE